jgi:cardiolipin synthase A/B
VNAAIWDRDTARALLRELLLEHLDLDVSEMGDRAALQFFRRVARENLARFAAGDPARQGLAFTLPSEQSADARQRRG